MSSGGPQATISPPPSGPRLLSHSPLWRSLQCQAETIPQNKLRECSIAVCFDRGSLAMATRLNASSITRAIDHLTKFGDTDVFPHLAEIVFLSEKKDEIVQELSVLDLESFNPAQAIETIAPKSRYGFRIVQQLLLLETLLFTAALIEIGSDLETLKRPLGENGPFAYRFSSGGDGSLFMKNHTYRDWLEWQSEKVKSGGYKEVICTDIADFYQRIYLHRIENTLDSATANKGIKRFIEKLIKQIRSKQSHGIPVGGTASRLIAESVLADSDNALADEEIEFTRFVDDYRIFVKQGQEPYSILAFLADQLAASEGFSLNAQKTKLYSVEKFKEHLDIQLGDAFDETEKEAIEALSHAVYFDEEISEEDMSKLRALNLLEMLEAEFSEEVWDFGKIKAIFRALRLAPDPDSVEFVVKKFDLFLPFMKDLVLYLDELDNAHDIDFTELQEKVLRQISEGAASSVPTIRVWLLELFVRDILEISSKELNALKAQETLDNRQIDLIRGRNGEVNYFRRQKTRFDERNLFEKSTFMLGATCLPKDEFETWIGAVRANMTRPLEKIYCDWIKTKNGRLNEVLGARSTLAKE
jgi:reverse transcriptase-like protein